MNEKLSGAESLNSEIISLNVDDLDIEELEQRLEMAAIDAGCESYCCGDWGCCTDRAS